MNTNSPAYKKGYAKSQLPHYWDWQKEQDRNRFKTEARRQEFDAGFMQGLRDKYKMNPGQEYNKATK